MTEEDFIYAWLLAAKSGAGMAVAWKDATIEAQMREARVIYQHIQQEKRNETSMDNGSSL